jgi:uncharacterized protein
MRRQLLTGLLAFVLLTACSGGSTAATPSATPKQATSPSPRPATSASPAPTPSLPPYAVQSLRARGYPGGQLNVGPVTSTGQGFTKHQVTWPSGGQTMTGTISVPNGAGPFPVVVVEHGFIPAGRYWAGQDSGIFGDPMASQGYIAVMPDWPGYSGSGPAPPGLPSIVGQLVTMLDLVTSMRTMPQADTGRLACVGHSNGSGICQLAMVTDQRFKAMVLHGPISSDMADNGRKWWVNNPEQLGTIGTPDQNPQGYRLLSPRTYFAAGQPPVLIIHGDNDTTCPLDWSQATLAALQRAGVKSDLRQFPGAEHDFVGQNLQQAVAAQTEWISQALR